LTKLKQLIEWLVASLSFGQLPLLDQEAKQAELFCFVQGV